MGRKRQDPVCLRGGGREGGRTAEVLFLREAIKLKLVALTRWKDSPISLSLLLGAADGGSPWGSVGARAAPQSIPGRRARRSRVSLRTRAPSALPRPARPRSPPHPGRWAREIQVKKGLTQSCSSAPVPVRGEPPGLGRSGTEPGALCEAAGCRRPNKSGLPSLHFTPEIWKWKLFDV